MPHCISATEYIAAMANCYLPTTFEAAQALDPSTGVNPAMAAS
jgi:hypothetical protein